MPYRAPRTAFKKGHIPWHKGKKLPFKSRPGAKGRKVWNKGIKTGLIPKTAFKKGFRPWNKGIKRPDISGKNCHLWRGGITPINLKIRSSLEYKLWREAVFKRDDYTCKFCGQRGGKLNADHIKPFAYFPELRFAIDNGRTLCIDCHRKTDNYAGKGFKRIKK